MNDLIKHIIFSSYLFLFLFVPGTLLAQSEESQNSFLLFDAGSYESNLNDYYQKLQPNNVYNAEAGYGWTINPLYSYYKKEMQTTTLRNDLTIDGVVGKEIEFKADIPSGNWYFTFWLDAGSDYDNTLKLYINGQETVLNWSKLYPGEGGSDKQMKIYRVYQNRVELSKSGFSYKLVGVKDSVRLCGFSLIPEIIPRTKNQLEIESLINLAGKYKSTTSLLDINNYLSLLVEQAPTDAYLVYWLQQVNLLYEAERISEMMGWEWARQITTLSIFDRLKQTITLLDGIIGEIDLIDNPLAEKALWYRGKIFYDLFLESGGSLREEFSKRDLAMLYELYPDDPNLKMLNGEKIDLPDPYDNLTNDMSAPRWSVLQRELYQRLSWEIDWWVNERQAANGEFGGKLGDDVELLRWWSPFLLTGNKTAISGWKKLADAVWYSPKVYNGYSKKVYDVEHASEFISDSTPELILFDNDSTYYHRLKYTAEYFENLWTIKNKTGHRFFKSAWYSSTEVDESPPRNIDVDYNARAVKPLRYLAWATRDKKFINLLYDWSISWVDIAMGTSKGKPIGILPSSIRAIDESTNGDGANWYEANTYWDYFDWHHSVGSKILDNIMFTYLLTGDSKLLKPIIASLELVRNFTYEHSEFMKRTYEQGSIGWTAKQMISNYHFWNVVEKWRILTDNNYYDDLIVKYGNDYTKYKLTNNPKPLEEILETSLNEIRFNTPLRTTLVLHTDRVRTNGANILKAMLTGDGTAESSSPYYAVTWDNTDKNFTALVGNFNKQNLSAQLFSHSKKDCEIDARFWLLENGKYNLVVKDIHEKVIFENKFVVTKPGERVKIVLPSETLINLSVKALK